VGGKLMIESGEGKGTRVTLIAPLDLGQSPAGESDVVGVSTK